MGQTAASTAGPLRWQLGGGVAVAVRASINSHDAVDELFIKTVVEIDEQLADLFVDVH